MNFRALTAIEITRIDNLFNSLSINQQALVIRISELNIKYTRLIEWLTEQRTSVLAAILLSLLTIIFLYKYTLLPTDYYPLVAWCVSILITYILLIRLIVLIFSTLIKYCKRFLIKNRLKNLSGSEKAILGDFLRRKTLTAYVNRGSGEYMGLAKDGFLYKAGDRNDGIEIYRIHRWLYEYLDMYGIIHGISKLS